jgi:hypothetical protein
MSMRRRVRVVLAIAIALAAAGGVAALAIHHDGTTRTRKAQKTQKAQTTPKPQRATAKKTYAQLTAANYKILKPKQTTRLLRYADAAYACMSKQVDLGKPRPLRTKIVMSLPPSATPAAIVQLGVRCAMTIGDPPRDASFQVRGHAVILYLPKYCILDNKVVALSRAPEAP